MDKPINGFKCDTINKTNEINYSNESFYYYFENLSSINVIQEKILNAIAILLYKFSGCHDVVIESFVEGRNYFNSFFIDSEIKVADLSFDKVEYELFKDKAELNEKQLVVILDSSSDINERYKKLGYDQVISLDIFEKNLRLECDYIDCCYTKQQVKYFCEKIKEMIHICFCEYDKKINLICLEDNFFKKKEEVKVESHSIVDLINKSIKEYGDEIAIESDYAKIKYDELGYITNAISINIRNKLNKSSEIIAIVGTESVEYIICVLSILKAGSAFIPIRSNTSIDQINNMLKIANCDKILLLDNDLSEQLKDYTIISLDDVMKFSVVNKHISNIDSDRLSYIIFTSGSTGNKKGVMIYSSSLCNYLLWAKKRYSLDEKMVMAFFTSIDVDLTITSTFLPLICGGRIVVYSDPNMVKRLLKIVKDDRVNTIKLTPSHLKIMTTINEKCNNLKQLILGGEELKKNLVNDVYVHFSEDIAIYNEYGPTEATVGCMCYKCDKKIDLRDSIQIGQEIDNCNIYVLDEDMQPALKYGLGEIYIGGKVLSNGYINNNEENSKHFLRNISENDEILYKTGDIVRIVDDNTLEYVGRNDQLIKIRGRRCSLLELEENMLHINSIKDLIVLYSEEKDIIYCVAEVNDELVKENELKNELKYILPDYLVPGLIKIVTNIPINSSGKKDKKQARKLFENLFDEEKEDENKVKNNTFEGMTNIQKELYEVWKEVLLRSDFSVNSNFFELGGNSLNVAVLAGKIYSKFNVMLELGNLFDYCTIEKQAYLIEYESRAANLKYAITKAEEKEYYKATYTQKRMYLYNYYNKDSINYNTPVAFTIKGEFDLDRANECIKKIIEMQEALRTSFEFKEGNVHQHIHDKVDFSINTLEIKSGDEQITIERLVKVFDLNKLPLLRINVAKYIDKENEYFCLIDMHHIITDGISNLIFIRDFCDLYNGKEVEQPIIQYSDYSEWQNDLIESGYYNKQIEYWENVYYDKPDSLNIVCGDIEDISKSEKNMVYFEIDEVLTNSINDYCANINVTKHMFLLSVYSIVVSQWWNSNDFVVGTATAGRVIEELYNVIGVFINTIPVRIKIDDHIKFSDFLMQVKEYVVRGYENSDIPIDMLVDLLPKKQYTNIIDCSFTTQDFNNFSLEDYKFGDANIKAYNYDLNLIHYAFNCVVGKTVPNISFTYEYIDAVFSKESIKLFMDCYTEISKIIVDNEDMSIGDLKNVIVKKRKK